MITIEKFHPQDRSAAFALDVLEEQYPFIAGPVAEVISHRQEHEHPQLIWVGQQIAGFFILDSNYAENYAFATPGTLGVRALLIDVKFQGQKNRPENAAGSS